MSSRPLVIGHRGASGYRPEHTRSAYELAFDQGADAVEPDIVASRDGVLVLRHENEISGTTDVATRPEFASRRVTKSVNGALVTGWFTEDFSWPELSTLRANERLPDIRPASAAFDGTEPILRLRDLMGIVDAASARAGRPLAIVAELKHAHHFASLGLPLDELLAAEVAQWATPENLIVESFEPTVLGQLRASSLPAKLVQLVEARGTPADLMAEHGNRARSFSDFLTDDGLARLADEVDGVSVSRQTLLRFGVGRKLIGTTDIVDRAHAAGLTAYCWTLRAENRFLAGDLRGAGGPSDYGDWMSEFRRIFATGVDGVFADQPDLALVARAAGASAPPPTIDQP